MTAKIALTTIMVESQKVSTPSTIKTVLIDNLDLEPVKFKLMKEENWTLARVDHTEKLYKGFLKLILLCPDQVAVPSLDIDEMWHTHILDTRKYIHDCVSIFGEYIHHYPYMGLKDDVDAAELKASFEKTKASYIAILGFDIFSGSAAADCGGGCGGGCGSSCGSSCSAPSSCSGHHTPSCGTFVPSAICGSTPSEREEKKREREKKKKPEEPKKDKNKSSWWPKLRFDAANADTPHNGFGRYDLSRQYRPNRAEVEAMGMATTIH